MRTSYGRLAASGILVAAAVGLPVAALASGSDTPTAKPSSPSATTAPKTADPTDFAALASSAGISVSRLETGLVAAKRAGGNGGAGIAAFARATGVTDATAQRIVYAVFGTRTDRSLTSPTSATVLANQLGVSPTAAQRALRQVNALSGEDGVDLSSPAFAAIAHQLGVQPSQLAAALDALKQSMAGK